MDVVVPGFTIERLLGQGGVGTVYRARDEDGRVVALKVLPLDTDRTRRARFEVEAKVGALIDHPDVIRIYGAGVDGTNGWIAMELLEGFELTQVIRRSSVDADARLRVIRRVALALQAAHDVEVIHRDVKPSNIFITDNGEVKLLDFGIARLAANKITKTGFIVGTPQYMSPEQISAKPIDTRTDVFALGVVTYEALSGRLPWTADNQTQLMIAMCSEPPTRLEHVIDRRFGLDDFEMQALTRIVHRALEHEPGMRYASAAEFADALETFLRRHESPLEARADADEAKRASFVYAMLLGALFVGLAAAVLFLMST